MSDQEIEKAIQAKDANVAPRVTPADIEANIVQVEVVRYVTQGGKVLRWAVLTTKNGYAVTGRPSACVSPENDNAEDGERIAIENAKNELWPLMGYELQSKLAGGAA